MEETFSTQYLKDTLRQFRRLKALGEGAMAQITDGEFLTRLDAEANSIAVLTKHLSGNMHARWKDFFRYSETESIRDRDSEFIICESDMRTELARRWNEGWSFLFDVLERMTEEDMTRTVTIRGEELPVIAAVNRQLAHYAYHVGQIVLLAKHFRSTEWKTLSVAKGKSEEFTKEMQEKRRAQHGH